MELTEVLLPKSARQAVAAAQAKYVYVIPDRAVRQPPLEALLVKSQPDQYVADAFPPLSYAPSATVLALRRGVAAAREQRPASLLTVGIANYTYHADGAMPLADGATAGETAVGAEYRALGGSLKTLAVAPEEYAQVEHGLEKGVAGANVSSLVADRATKANLRSALPGRRFVHLATRGVIDEKAGNLFGAMVLASSHGAGQDDDFLALNEIPALPLEHCQLAALSHCESRPGQTAAGAPNFWLARALMAAGAEDVVSSHWDVDDRAAAQMMGTFFETIGQDLRNNVQPRLASALQTARNSFRRDPRWAAPHYWAGWALVGPTR